MQTIFFFIFTELGEYAPELYNIKDFHIISEGANHSVVYAFCKKFVPCLVGRENNGPSNGQKYWHPRLTHRVLKLLRCGSLITTMIRRNSGVKD